MAIKVRQDSNCISLWFPDKKEKRVVGHKALAFCGTIA
jgi:hypothetical protein